MIRIYIAEDQGLLAGALETLLSLEEDFQIVGVGKNGAQAYSFLENHSVDVVLLDVEMPELTGLDVLEKTTNQHAKFIMLTTFSKPGYFRRAVEQGASGYLLKDSSSDFLAESIRKVDAGEKVYAPELMTVFFSDLVPISERERLLLKCLESGMENKEIAQELHLSNGTIRNYLSDLFHKIEVKNRTEAVSLAKTNGWI